MKWLITIFILLLGGLIMFKTNQKNIRPAAVAGSFYPADKNILAKELDGYLNNAQKTGKDYRVLIVPHAGLVYSGRTAGYGFKQIEDRDFQRVILIGPSHQVYLNEAVTSGADYWETPLGRTAVEKSDFTINDKAFAQEHSLEVELIFLQRILKNFKIIPILINEYTDISDKIIKLMDDNTLLVVSSDLSHYHPYNEAQKLDQKTIESIINQGKEIDACGRAAIEAAMAIAQKMGIKFEKIYAENSGDTSGDKSQVVGYAAIGGYRETSPVEDWQKEALTIARKTLEEYLHNGEKLKFKILNSKLNEKLGAFVTLRKNGQLRGCIGLFEPNLPLYQVIQQMAIAAATEDPRFYPVSYDELKEIKIEISVMTPKKLIDDYHKIELGKHGVVIERGGRSGTFLPQVATETGWNLDEFLGELCSQKAGLPRNCYRDSQTKIYTFEAEVFEE
ncbi:MAG TPA: AmmeMemoRadiSam system protein B [Candidatus Woesebacteria bacterium]|nr:AmmeMemoRadiSam system protein B [Candidatus Woesebacteria bacterium]